MTATAGVVLRAVREPGEADAVREVLFESLERDQGYGYRPEWHWDMDHVLEVYVDNPRNVMVAAWMGDTVVGTCAVRVGAPREPAALWDVLPPRDRVAQLARLVVRPEARRHGLGRLLVEECLAHARRDPGFDVVYLHTNGRTPGAVAFWLACGARRLELQEVPTGAEDHLDVVHMLLWGR